MVLCNRIASWGGGGGCTTFHHLRILSKRLLGKVCSLPLSRPQAVDVLEAVGRQIIECNDTELVTLEPLAGQTCGTYMAQYISTVGGYLTNPDATTGCQFCSSRTTDEWLGPQFNIFYHNHWRDFGLFWAYILFNVSRKYTTLTIEVLTLDYYRLPVYIS